VTAAARECERPEEHGDSNERDGIADLFWNLPQATRRRSDGRPVRVVGLIEPRRMSATRALLHDSFDPYLSERRRIHLHRRGEGFGATGTVQGQDGLSALHGTVVGRPWKRLSEAKRKAPDRAPSRAFSLDVGSVPVRALPGLGGSRVSGHRGRASGSLTSRRGTVSATCMGGGGCRRSSAIEEARNADRQD
jgi:hypothetical protein